MSAFATEKEEEVKMDPNILEKLKNKKEQLDKETQSEEVSEENMMSIISEQEVSINMAIVGIGQAGSRVAEEFHKLGYDVGVINTSAQDLKFIDVQENQKLLLDGSLGGTGKDLNLGREIFEDNIEKVNSFINNVIDGNDMVFLAISGGGGTGSSSANVIVPELFNTGMPVGVIYILPKTTEDAQAKRNSVETLAGLSRLTADGMVSSLIVVDNARIESIYANLSQMNFWSTANKAIVEPIHLFNSMTAQPSRYTSLDPSDFGKVISCGDCSVYGVINVEDYMEETALAESVLYSLSGNMLAEGFDLAQTRVGGVIITGSEKALSKLPAINIDYCFHMISEQTNGANIYQGIYTDPNTDTDSLKIYSWFSGLGLPKDRIENLQKESEEQAGIAAEKEKARGSRMTLDLEENKTKNIADQIHQKISNKKSGFNKLQRSARTTKASPKSSRGTSGRVSLIDKRRKGGR